MMSYYEKELQRIEEQSAVRSAKYDILEKDVDEALKNADKKALQEAFDKMLAIYEGKPV